MKHVKMLGVAVIAAAALTAVSGASTASATTLTCPSGFHCTEFTTIHAVSEGKAVLDSLIGNIECESTVHIETLNTGGTGISISATVLTLIFNNCNSTVSVLANGSLVIIGEAGNKGELKSSGAKVTVEKSGFHCIFETSNTKIGTVTGGTTAKLDISATIPRVGGRSGAFCGSSAPWTGSYSIDTPDTLNIDQ